MGKKKSKKGDDGNTPNAKLKYDDTLPVLHYGFGEFTLPNGDMYIGEYCAHRRGVVWRQGYGIYKTQDNQYYEGDWNDDKLVENKEIIITYPNGAQYYGCILKNKYNGPGTYTLRNDMSLSCQFAANKPTGTITLIDREGKLWSGVARENSAILLPENIFYINLNNFVGKGISKEPLVDIPMPTSVSTSAIESEIEFSDREWERIIFAKSTLTEDDVDFADCKWCKDFEKFKFRYDEIKKKIDEESSLDENDRAWIRNFRKFKRMKLMEKEQKELKKKEEKDRVFALNKIFQSKDFNTSCPAVKVFYPSKYWDPTYRQVIDEEISELSVIGSENIIDLTGGKDVLVKSIALEKSQSLVPKSSWSSSEEDQVVQFNELVQCSNEQLLKLTGFTSSTKKADSKKSFEELESDDELHFTKSREQMLLEEKLDMLAEKKYSVDKFATIKSNLSLNLKMARSKDVFDETRKEKKISKPNLMGMKSTEKVHLDRKTKLENRVKGCVAMYLEERQHRLEQVNKVAIGIDVLPAHTHNISAYTESVTGIPREYLIEK